MSGLVSSWAASYIAAIDVSLGMSTPVTVIKNADGSSASHDVQFVSSAITDPSSFAFKRFPLVALMRIR